MTTCCTLETEGFRVVFNLRNPDAAREYVDGRIELSLQPGLSPLSIQSMPTFLGVTDFRQLVAYFEEHLRRLRDDPGAESTVFVPLELGFQIQALAGEVNEQDEGEFTVRFLVNVGQQEGC